MKEELKGFQKRFVRGSSGSWRSTFRPVSFPTREREELASRSPILTRAA